MRTQEMNIKPTFPWEAVVAINADVSTNILENKIDDLSQTLDSKDGEIRDLNRIAESLSAIIRTQRNEIDMCVNTLAQLKTASTVDEIKEILAYYEVHVDEIPFIN